MPSEPLPPLADVRSLTAWGRWGSYGFPPALWRDPLLLRGLPRHWRRSFAS